MLGYWVQISQTYSNMACVHHPCLLVVSSKGIPYRCYVGIIFPYPLLPTSKPICLRDPALLLVDFCGLSKVGPRKNDTSILGWVHLWAPPVYGNYHVLA